VQLAEQSSNDSVFKGLNPSTTVTRGKMAKYVTVNKIKDVLINKFFGKLNINGMTCFGTFILDVMKSQVKC
jgi:hypothetical protein